MIGQVSFSYAVELCARLDPVAFLDRLVPLLAHPDASVACAAFRLIKHLLPQQGRVDLLSEIATIPVVVLFTDDPRSGTKWKMGTNERFLRDLLEGKTPRLIEGDSRLNPNEAIMARTTEPNLGAPGTFV